MKIKVVHDAEPQQTQQNQSAQQPQQPANPQPRRKLGCLGKTIIGVGVYFLFCGILGAMMGDMMSTPVTVLEDNTIYRIDLSGVLVDQATEENPFDLDDVLSELDDYRQSHLLNTIQGDVQTFVTTTSVEGIDHQTLREAATFQVKSGTMSRLK